jgi:hypothetical protein
MKHDASLSYLQSFFARPGLPRLLYNRGYSSLRHCVTRRTVGHRAAPLSLDSGLPAHWWFLGIVNSQGFSDLWSIAPVLVPFQIRNYLLARIKIILPSTPRPRDHPR